MKLFKQIVKMKGLALLAAGVLPLGFSACVSTPTGEGAATGAAMGALAGGLIGKQSGETGEGAVLGALIGAGVGSAVGNSKERQGRVYNRGYNSRGYNNNSGGYYQNSYPRSTSRDPYYNSRGYQYY